MNQSIFDVLTTRLYINSLADNVRMSKIQQAKQGYYMGLAPLGYKNIRNAFGKNDIIVDDEKAPIIIELFNAYATGLYSLDDIVKLAHTLGLKNKKGNFISKTYVLSILKNHFYYGKMKIYRKLYPHKYQTIIDKSF